MDAMDGSDLSPRQREVLEAIEDAIAEGGRAPTVRELAASLGLRAPGTIQDHVRALERKGYLVRDSGARNLRSTRPRPSADRLPIVGRIAAGRPIESYEELESFTITEDLPLEGAFLLRVKGDSMIEDHIADGDLVVVRPQNSARDGEIVVAILPGGEATLKRVYREKDHIRLQPANSLMEPIRVPEITIQGRVVAVIRKLL